MLKAILKEAWISIFSYKLRTFLTMLGIVIGVAAVVMMVSAGQVVQNVINQTFASMGSNLIMIAPASIVSGGVRGGRGKPTVTLKDIEALKTIEGVEVASYSNSGAVQAVYGANNYGVSIRGTNIDFLVANNWEIEDGVMFTDKDAQSARPYVVIGQTIIDELFGIENPIGKKLRLGGKPFYVIGTLKAKGDNLMGDDQDNIILMPNKTFLQRVSSSQRPQYVNFAVVKAQSEELSNIVAKRVEFLLRSRHRLKDGVANDFEVKQMNEIVEKAQSIGLILSILLAVIASISLLVGSIGIMNMMLVSVTERTREIGTRKALGAPNTWIMTQFLTESVMISFIGSFLGMLWGILFSQLAGYILGYEVPISIWSVVVSISVAVIVGVLSGLMPALKAMRLNPIDALRYQ